MNTEVQKTNQSDIKELFPGEHNVINQSVPNTDVRHTNRPNKSVFFCGHSLSRLDLYKSFTELTKWLNPNTKFSITATNKCSDLFTLKVTKTWEMHEICSLYPNSRGKGKGKKITKLTEKHIRIRKAARVCHLGAMKKKI